MTKIKILDNEYEVKFLRQAVQRFVRGHGTKPMIQTTCVIYLAGNGPAICVAMGNVVCNHRDQDTRRRGYKAALTKALTDSVFDKPERALIWSQLKGLHV